VSEEVIGVVRRLTDNQLQLVQRIVSSDSDIEHLRAALDAAKPHMQALESATHSSMERAQALMTAETRVAELRGMNCPPEAVHPSSIDGQLVHCCPVAV
jgi:hypothetical protein